MEQFTLPNQFKNQKYIFHPNDPLIGLTDASAVEQSAIVTQWCKKKLDLEIIAAKSTLFTTAQRRQSPLHRESLGVNQLLQIARPYLLQSKSPNNYIFCDASSISYISRVKPFSNFLQQLADEMSKYPGLQVAHAFERSLC